MNHAELPVDHGKQSNEASKNPDGEQPPRKPGSKEKGRKRTKTGCLTCRKRRIKCGEERPTCQNCTKSKRQCEGYNQRVVFKDPLNAYRPSLSALQGSFSGRGSGSSVSHHGVLQQHTKPTQTPLPIAPKLGPRGSSFRTVDLNIATAADFPPATSVGSEQRQYIFQNDTRNTPSSNSLPPQPLQPVEINFDTVDRSYLPEPNQRPQGPEEAVHYDFNALVEEVPKLEALQTPTRTSSQDWSAGPYTSAALYHSFATSAEWKPQNVGSSTATSSAFSSQTHRGSTSHVIPENELKAPVEKQEWYDEMFSNHQEAQPHLDTQFSQRTTEWPTEQSTVSTSAQGYTINDDDDPFDVSDDDTPMGDYTGSATWEDDFLGHIKSNDLGIVVATQAGQERQGQVVRSFKSFIDRPDMLANYIPSPQSSPLSDNMSARIFCHFVNVTAPSISLFERHPANPSLIFQGQPVPLSQQHIWTYTFSTVALRHPALLHAMLALASIQIAKLQGEPITAALKQYAISLRRTAKCIGSPTRRSEPATLAAAMLLAFFEVWTADHQKWTNHLLGARQLVREIDFAGMTRYIKSQKVQKRWEERMRYYQTQQQGVGYNFYDDRLRHQAYVDDVDETIVSMLMGKKLSYDQFGQVVDDTLQDDGGKTYSDRDLELYETQRDLFWWYCKQDAYQAILGGGRLFMAYDLWSHCPPRAAPGRLNATYGTYDHVILLLGRVADFAAKDIKRKRKQIQANGGWRPPRSMFNNDGPKPGPGTGPQAQPPSFPPMPHQQGPPQMPPMPDFSGMVPGIKEPQMPMGFSSTRDTSPESTQSAEDLDLEAKHLEADEEWQDIRNGFSILEDHFGEDFQALGPEFSAPIQTPFGPALQYRTYGIAGIWMNFYMALIACHRAHPSMPPAAMMAAG
ncbi:putative transcriptional regulatory protein, partial [Lachnellula occidentalis]